MERYHATSVLSLTARQPGRAGAHVGSTSAVSLRSAGRILSAGRGPSFSAAPWLEPWAQPAAT